MFADSPTETPGLRSARVGGCQVRRSPQGCPFDGECDGFRLRRFKPDATVHEQGGCGRDLLILREGQVKLERTSGDRRRIIEILQSGDLIAFDPLMGTDNITAARALGAVTVCYCNAAQAKSTIEASMTLPFTMLKHLARQLERSRLRFVHLGSPKARNRLAAYLCMTTQHQHAGPEPNPKLVSPGPRAPAVTHFVPGDLSLVELSEILGLSTETVCRARGQLRKHGLIDIDRRRIIIRDLAALRRLAADES